MVTLKKTFEIDAGHRLSKHEFECQNLHGHRYRFEVEVDGKPDPNTGMVVDFATLKQPVVDAFDHNLLLNEADPILAVRDVLEDHQEQELYLMDTEPTVENITLEALDLIEARLTPAEHGRIDTIRLTVHETPTSSAQRERVIT